MLMPAQGKPQALPGDKSWGWEVGGAGAPVTLGGHQSYVLRSPHGALSYSEEAGKGSLLPHPFFGPAENSHHYLG